MQHKLVDQLVNNRASLFEVITATVILAISASGIASIIFEKFKSTQYYLLAFFILITLFGIFILTRKFLNMKNYKLEIEAFLIIDPIENKLVEIPRYDYSEYLDTYLNSAFTENPALLSQWNKEPLNSIFTRKSNEKTLASITLIKEATEYYILYELTTHLTDYFNKEQYSESELCKYSRERVPDILLSNRFMELFTAPMANRMIFNDENVDHDNDNILVSYGKNGALYHHFDLILPSKTIVSRNEAGAIVFDTENFILTYNVNFDAFNFLVPRGFEKYYLGITKHERSSEYQIILEFEVEFKLASVFKNTKWNYHAWIDSFLDEIENTMSAKSFFNKINWELAYTMILSKDTLKK